MILMCVAAPTWVGCHAAHYSSTTMIDAWAARQGGVIQDQRLQRITSIGQVLTAEAGCAGVTFSVLDSQSFAAYSWPTGELFLTAGLIDHVTDDELAAAIAHELGHLLNGRHIQTSLSLRGTPAKVDIEQRADLTGCQLLLATGRSPDSLKRVLMKVCAAAATQECRNDIRQRIALLDAQYPREMR